jgi:hypothetical protein
VSESPAQSHVSPPAHHLIASRSHIGLKVCDVRLFHTSLKADSGGSQEDWLPLERCHESASLSPDKGLKQDSIWQTRDG